jgi:hypothetical protein
MKSWTTLSTLLLTATLGHAALESKDAVPAVAIHKPLTAGAGGDLVQQLLDTVPPDVLRMLTDPATFEEGQKEINQYFGHNFVGKPAILQAKIEAAGPYAQGPNKYHIRATSAPLKWVGGEMGRLNWFYFTVDQVPAAARAKVGSEVVVSGIIVRCEVANPKGFLKINFDLGDCILEPR